MRVRLGPPAKSHFSQRKREVGHPLSIYCGLTFKSISVPFSSFTLFLSDVMTDP